MGYTPPITSENWPTLLLPGLRRVFDLQIASYTEAAKREVLFTIDTSAKAVETDQAIGGLGQDDWNFEDSQQVQYDAVAAGYDANYTHREFAKGLLIRRKFLDDNLYPAAGLPTQITRKVKKLADAAFVIRELSAAEVFRNAHTGSGRSATGFLIPGPDGQALCSASHPLGPNDGATLSNTSTAALSVSAIKTDRANARRWTDDRGNITPVRLSELVVPPELEDDALVIARSLGLPGSADNDANVTGARITEVHSWEYLTDTNNWYHCDPRQRAEFLTWFDRIPLEFDSMGDFDTLQAKYRVYARWSRGFSHWAWLIGHNVT